MKKILFCAVASLIATITWSQDKEGAEKLVDAGVELHDKGDYNGALAKYDKALELDANNLLALAEKAYTQLSLNQNREAIENCRLAIAKHPGDPDLSNVYVTYGNALDGLNESEEAIRVYEEGIAAFPDNYMLYFNKGIALALVERIDEAKAEFKHAMSYNPKHPGSHNALARLSDMNDKHIPALLAYSRFLVLEPEGGRAEKNLENLRRLMGGGAEKTGKNSVTINISPDALGDTLADGSAAEDNFVTTDLILSMSGAMDFDKKNKKKSEVELFIEKFDIVCSSLKEGQADHTGFFWDYYVPYFVSMKENNQIETFAYIAYVSSGEASVLKWVKANNDKIRDFYAWSNEFEWSEKGK